MFLHCHTTNEAFGELFVEHGRLQASDRALISSRLTVVCSEKFHTAYIHMGYVIISQQKPFSIVFCLFTGRKPTYPMPYNVHKKMLYCELLKICFHTTETSLFNFKSQKIFFRRKKLQKIFCQIFADFFSVLPTCVKIMI